MHDDSKCIFTLTSPNTTIVYSLSHLMLQKVQTIEKQGFAFYSFVAKYPDLLSLMHMETDSYALRSRVFNKKITANIVLSNRQTMEWIKTHFDVKFSSHLIKQIHKILTQNIYRGQAQRFSGEFRQDKVYIINPNGTLKREGLNFQKIELALEESLDLLNKNAGDISPLLNNMLLEYLLIYIHPFCDDNGRTALALFYFNAFKNQLNFFEILGIERYRRINRQKYFNTHKAERNICDITSWLDFNLDAIQDALKIASKKTAFLLKTYNFKEYSELSKTELQSIHQAVSEKFTQFENEDDWAFISKQTKPLTFKVLQI